MANPRANPPFHIGEIPQNFNSNHLNAGFARTIHKLIQLRRVNPRLEPDPPYKWLEPIKACSPRAFRNIFRCNCRINLPSGRVGGSNDPEYQQAIHPYWKLLTNGTDRVKSREYMYEQFLTNLCPAFARRYEFYGYIGGGSETLSLFVHHLTSY